MRRLLQLFSLAILGAAVVAAHADPITAGTYNLNDVSVHGFQLTGSVTLNSSGLVSAASITLNDAALSNPVFNQINSVGGPAGYAPVANFAYIAGADGQIYLSYLTAPDGLGNVDLCILSAGNCNAYQASYSQIYISSTLGYNPVDLDGGTLNPATTPSATPEPSSLALLGTAILGAAEVMRRRYFKA